MEGLRRTSRKTERVHYADTLSPSYPENPPQNLFEQRIASLNDQSFPSLPFSIVDDALVYSLFSSKRRTSGYRTMIPERAFRDEKPPITKEQGLAIRHIYKDCVGEQGKGLEENIRAACRSMEMLLPEVFTRDKIPILQQ
jgi:hypothetical protein